MLLFVFFEAHELNFIFILYNPLLFYAAYLVITFLACHYLKKKKINLGGISHVSLPFPFVGF